MARPSLELIDALRRAAKQIETSADYQWGHMGACNCGFLAQQITHLDKNEIHRRAMMRYGDWNEQLNDYCPTSGLAMDDLISTLLNFGFDTDDLRHLERLSDKEVLQRLPEEKRYLHHNERKDVVTYMLTWASLLEEKLAESIDISSLTRESAKKEIPV